MVDSTNPGLAPAGGLAPASFSGGIVFRLRRLIGGELGVIDFGCTVERLKGNSIKTANYYLVASRVRPLVVAGSSGRRRSAGRYSKLAHEEPTFATPPRLTAEEFDLFLRAARESNRAFRRLSGADRFFLYLTAAANRLACGRVGKPDT